MAEGKMCELLGKSLLRKIGDEFIQIDTDQSEGLGEKDFVGLYFSAHWCPPCRGFTPRLTTFYENMKKNEANKFEIVFVSSDRDEPSFKEYASEMPWLYLPFADRDRKAQLSKKFKISGIPTLVILNAKTGDIVTHKGRAKVESDPEGAMFPWVPKTYREILNGDDDFLKKVKGKVHGLYFSADWCPPCKTFTPQLVKKHQELKDAGKPFEIIFVSSDKNEESYKKYSSQMTWGAFPYKDPRCESLKEIFDVEGFPTLVLMSAEGKLITKNGRESIMELPIEDFPYENQPVNKVSSRFVDTFNSSSCLIYFTDSAADVQKYKDIMSGTAKKYFKHGDEQKLYFFVGVYSDEDNICNKLYSFLIGDEKRQCLVIADISNGNKYMAADHWTMSEDNIQEFVTKFEAGKIDATSL